MLTRNTNKSAIRLVQARSGARGRGCLFTMHSTIKELINCMLEKEIKIFKYNSQANEDEKEDAKKK